jgi:hypothetical protein
LREAAKKAQSLNEIIEQGLGEKGELSNVYSSVIYCVDIGKSARKS